ncbi:MAG: AtpZ/AtpI family protein [Armatimonadetes bacterium]|nr:AtpZ/AtpI family protein [Armatimonadota bacterium]
MRAGRDSARWAAAAHLATLGTVMGACVAIGLGLGAFLDRKLGTAPWLAVTGTIFGTAAAFREMLRMVRGAQGGKDEDPMS